MTLDTILKAAVNSMIHGHHAPHCYSARIQGRGYVNNGEPPFDRADYLKQLERDAMSEIENMGFAADYAEPGYAKPKLGILFANWNKLPRELDAILEKLGYEVEWSDEWFVCECGKAVRTEPDGYDWKPLYKEVYGELMCVECAKDAE